MNPLQTPTLAGPALRGEVVRPGDAAYDELRRLPNAQLDRRPALIARVAGEDDVAAAIAYARARSLPVAVRGGGHSPFGVVDDAVVVDVRALDHVVVDADARTVRVGGGALAGAVDATLAAHGLALTTPRFPTVGMAGFTLGSGSGWLERAMGLAPDNLLEATVVAADGRVVRTSAGEHADLFWALRGGGGNFGVVTELVFRTMPLGPEVVGGFRAYPVARLREVAWAYGAVMAAAPDRLCGGLVLRCAPDRPDVPAELRGEPIVVVVALWAGDAAEAPAGLAALDGLGEPLIDTIRPLPLADFQQLLVPPPDTAAPAGPPPRGYAKFGFLDTLDEAAIDLVDELTGELCTKQSLIILQPLGGAVARSSPADSALGNRSAGWAFQLITSWTDPAEDAPNIAWTRAAAAELVELGRPPSWPNFITDEHPRRLLVPFAPETLARLKATKRTWDPENVFRANHNIPPA